LPCAVGYALAEYIYYGGRTWAWNHRWPGGDRKAGYCLNCGKILKEVTVRINPKTGEPVRGGSLARDIAKAFKDVPPVLFVGQPGQGARP
jgi:hypothetical protein